MFKGPLITNVDASAWSDYETGVFQVSYLLYLFAKKKIKKGFILFKKRDAALMPPLITLCSLSDLAPIKRS
jgi:hypothetical protein